MISDVLVGKTFVKPKVVEEQAFFKRRPKRPDRLCKMPKARPQSAPGSRPKSAATEKPASGSKPFYNYGGGAVDESLGQKKTFNVRASSAVSNKETLDRCRIQTYTNMDRLKKMFLFFFFSRSAKNT